MFSMPWTIFALYFFVVPICAQSNGIDSSMDMPMNLAVGNMLSYLHFTPGDTIWFLGWVPSGTGAMVGTCIGLFLFSILERWTVACLGLAEQHWVERTNTLMHHKSDDVSFPPSSESPTLSLSLITRWLRRPAFVAEFDVTRGVLFGIHAFLKVFLMMAIMTFQLSFILSIAVGSGVGETLFGRLSSPLHES